MGAQPLPGGRRFRIIAAAALVILAVIAGVVLLDVLDEADVVARQRYAVKQFVFPALVLLAAVAVVVAYRATGRWRTLPVGVLPLLVMVEAAALAEPFLPRVPKSRFYTDTSPMSSWPTTSGPIATRRAAPPCGPAPTRGTGSGRSRGTCTPAHVGGPAA